LKLAPRRNRPRRMRRLLLLLPQQINNSHRPPPTPWLPTLAVPASCSLHDKAQYMAPRDPRPNTYIHLLTAPELPSLPSGREVSHFRPSKTTFSQHVPALGPQRVEARSRASCYGLSALSLYTRVRRAGQADSRRSRPSVGSSSKATRRKPMHLRRRCLEFWRTRNGNRRKMGVSLYEDGRYYFALLIFRIWITMRVIIDT